jgi:hypothetical protein
MDIQKIGVVQIPCELKHLRNPAPNLRKIPLGNSFKKKRASVSFIN